MMCSLHMRLKVTFLGGCPATQGTHMHGSLVQGLDVQAQTRLRVVALATDVTTVGGLMCCHMNVQSVLGEMSSIRESHLAEWT